MAQIPSDVERKVRDYIAHLRQEITITGAIVFGSYATAQWSRDSDIDIAVFSDFFAGKNRAESIAFLLQRALAYDLDIQPVAFDDRELENYQENPFLREIITKGIRVA